MSDDMREEISETRKKVKAAHAAIQALCNRERFLMSIPANRKTDHDLIISDALLALDADLEIAEAANREKDAEIALLRSEADENARIIGMSGSREAAKDAEIARLNNTVAMMRSAIRRIENQSVRLEGDQVYVQMWHPVWQALTDCLANCAVNGYVQKLEAELSSLRASVGDKPEDAWKRGQEEVLRRVGNRLMDRGMLLNFSPCSYVAPPSTDKES